MDESIPASTKLDTAGTPRRVRVAYPVEAAFEGERFVIEEFTLNLSVSGIFLPTTAQVEPFTRGTLTFRPGSLAPSFTVAAEVVRIAPDGGREPQGLGIQFIELTDRDKRRLARLVDGAHECNSIVDQIRQAVHQGQDLATVLRHRPTDHKMLLATRAQKGEIETLIREGMSPVVLRLLENPRVTPDHIKAILRQTRVNAPVLLAIHRNRLWMKDQEVTFLYAMHPNADLREALAIIPTLPVPSAAQIMRNGALRPQLRAEAKKRVLRAQTAGV